MKKEYSSRTKNSLDIWATPPILFNRLNDLVYKRFGREFSVDICATKKTAKCEKYFDEKINGLIQDLSGEVAFCNPPYIDKRWISKCFHEGQKDNTIVVMLLPVRADTGLFHDYIMKAHEIWFLKGRVWFLLDGIEQKQTNFASMFVIFMRTNNKTPYIKSFFHKKQDLAIESNKTMDDFLKEVKIL